MNLNHIEAMIPAISKMMKLNSQQQTQLKNAVQKAKSEAAKYGDSEEAALRALTEYGIGSEFLQKIQSYANNPLASGIANMMGINMAEVKSALSQLTKKATNTPKPPAAAPVASPAAQDPLERLRKGIAGLKAR